MSPVAIGARRVRGTLQGPTVVQDPVSGQEIETVGPIATDPIEWAAVRTLSGREFVEAHQVFGANAAALTFRYRSDLTSRMSFLTDEGQLWVFVSPPIDPDGRRVELEVMATLNE